MCIRDRDKIEAEMKQYKQQDEDVLSYALFPQVATEFFKYRQAQQTKVDTTIADTKNGAYPVSYTHLDVYKRQMEIIVTFLAVLELMKMGKITIYQDKIFDDIRIESKVAA